MITNASFLSLELDSSYSQNARFYETANFTQSTDPILAEKLRIAQDPVNWMIGHLFEIYSELKQHDKLNILEKRRIAFE